jgi:ATP synthase protein I
LLYSPGRAHAPMNGLGRAAAYFALFSEIGLILLVTVLAGVLGGYWVDQQLGTLPIFLLVGLLIGLGGGALAMYRMISRFLARYQD